jgi:pimeloyl-ACP methyl ester carboxylesterase
MKKLAVSLLSATALLNQALAREGEYATVNGLHMYYEIHGNGTPLVLIHGAGSTIQTTFGRLLPELEKTHQVIAVELQAHGHSDNRDGRPTTFEQDADDVAELMRQLHIAKADIFGFSNGGTTALQVAIRHPDRVNKLIVASSMYKRAGVVDAFWKGFDHPSIDQMPEAYKKAFLAINPSQAALQTMFDQCVQRMKHFTDIPDSVIASIQAPTLIMMGDKDVPLPEHAIEMYHRLPHASVAIFPGGHGAYMGEVLSGADPVALPVIDAFLAQ